MKRYVPVAGLLALLTVLAFVLQGYHPGAEDDAVYLSAVKKDLTPSLYPYNAEFFTLQMQASVFDKAVAVFVRITHLPLAYCVLLLQLTCIYLLLIGCWQVAGYCYQSFRARFAGVLTVGCLLTLSVAGTALYISDEHLHPRLIATDAIVFAVSATQRGRWLQASLLLLVALLFHPIMAMFGISFCLLYGLVSSRALPAISKQQVSSEGRTLQAAGIPGAWLFAPSTPAWRQALQQHSYYNLTRWAWYEWLGAIAPPLLLLLLRPASR